MKMFYHTFIPYWACHCYVSGTQETNPGLVWVTTSLPYYHKTSTKQGQVKVVMQTYYVINPFWLPLYVLLVPLSSTGM